MKRKDVTMGDIADALGISKNAVSLALAGKDGISDSLRRDILKKAEEMNYTRAEKSARNLVALIPRRIAPGVGSGFFYQGLCFQMESYARSKGDLLIICSVSEEEEDACVPHPILRQLPCAGVLTIGNFSRDYCRMISETGLRYVMVDQYYDSVLVDSVNTANTSAGYLLTEHLIQMGHRDIQFFGSPRKTSSLDDRWNGYKRAMRDYGLPVQQNRFLEATDRDSRREYDLIRDALEALPDLPTAFVCGHDMSAKTIVELLAGRGLSFPRDFSIVGFDNVQDPSIAPMNLTSYRTPQEKIAHSAVDILMDERPVHPLKLQVFGEIVYRDSVRDIR